VSTLMAAIEGSSYRRLRGRGTGWMECHYEKGSRGGGTQLGGKGGEPAVVHVAAARHWPARGYGDFSWAGWPGGPSRPDGRWARWLGLASRPRLGKWPGRLSWTGRNWERKGKPI
jgi:hypothetical protein